MMGSNEQQADIGLEQCIPTNNNYNYKRGLQGPRPTPLKICRESQKKISKPSSTPMFPVQQNRQPVIIYTRSPKIIHTQPKDFMALVQRLTGSSDTRSRSRKSSNNIKKKKKKKKTVVGPSQVLEPTTSISYETKSFENASPLLGHDHSYQTKLKQQDDDNDDDNDGCSQNAGDGDHKGMTASLSSFANAGDFWAINSPLMQISPVNMLRDYPLYAFQMDSFLSSPQYLMDMMPFDHSYNIHRMPVHAKDALDLFNSEC